ncbi:MAG: hypothetical protein DRI86_11650 [Bacteroidetes bacterium]|nr:MAG: hypothetical protein DRI86_11650 [Bacteroidota bacterium]
MKKLLLSVTLFFIWVMVLYLIPVDLGVENNSNLPDDNINIEQSLFSIDINEIQTTPSVNTIDPSLCINSTMYFYRINSKNKNFIFGL